MKKIITALMLATLAAACTDDSDVFYTTTYPIVRLEVAVAFKAKPVEPTDPTDPTEPTEPTNPTDPAASAALFRLSAAGGNGESTDGEGNNGNDGGDGNDGSDGGDGDSGSEENPLAQQIRETVLSEAVVQVGGSYRLEFTRYDGGSLTIVAAEGAEPVAGTFDKTPGSSQITFYYPYGQTDREENCKIETVTDEEGVPSTVLKQDLTSRFQKDYPDANIESVALYQYTLHP